MGSFAVSPLSSGSTVLLVHVGAEPDCSLRPLGHTERVIPFRALPKLRNRSYVPSSSLKAFTSLAKLTRQALSVIMQS